MRSERPIPSWSTATTRALLEHWNDIEQREPSKRLFFCQLEAIETLIWLTESPAAGRVGIDTFGVFLHLGGSNQIPLTYVDNCADAIALAGLKPGIDGEVFNIGGDTPVSLRELTKLLIATAGRGHVEYVEWPADKKAMYLGFSQIPVAIGWTLEGKLGPSLYDGVLGPALFLFFRAFGGAG